MSRSLSVTAKPEHYTLLISILAAEAFLVLFQAYLVAPLIPALSESLNAPVSALGLLIPAYTIPYGLSTLIYGPLSDRVGRKPILLALFGLQALSCLLIPLCSSVTALIAIRIMSGLATGGIIPVSVSLIGDIFPYQKRGKYIGLLFGAMAGGISFGASMGIFFNPILGWRNEFMIAGTISLAVFIVALINHHQFPVFLPKPRISTKVIVRNGYHLLSSGKGSRLYLYIFLNGLFHSGVFSWLGYYFKIRYGLADQGIGLALLGYGIPGMLLGVTIGKLADSHGRQKILPWGLMTGAIAVLVLSFNISVWYAAIAVTLLSLGYDMTQPLFAGMVTSVGKEETRGLAVALSACVLFLGYGAGAYIFQQLLTQGLKTSFSAFAAFEFFLGLIALKLLKNYS
ncbi:MFS transporter [Pedobacter sp. UBA5917]|jgi:predicted MFS family arabinose efflux permease|uniref:MFS transporter n=1 Tax=Pedobacter sp. UBA5917 TaxID=1947061 RepID=UPI0025E8DC1B|nr:MFS transporter [Pedobacter sp. UBA5917]